MKKAIFAILFTLILSIPAFAEMTFYSAVGYRPGEVVFTITDGAMPYTVAISDDKENYTDILTGHNSNNFTLSGLANGTTYYIRVTDSTGKAVVKKYTPPFLVIDNIQFTVSEITDNTALFTWSWLDVVYPAEITLIDMTKNSTRNFPINEMVTQMSIDNLSAGHQYKAFFTSSNGYVTNIITFKTTTFQGDLLSRLDAILNNLFVPKNNVDSDSDGIPDPYDKIYDSWKRWENYGPIGKGKEIIGIVEDITDGNIPAGNLPNFQVTIAGNTINVLNFEPFMEQITIFRNLMAAAIWITFFFFIIKTLIPMFKV